MVAAWFRRLSRETNGTVAVLFGVMLVPLIIAIGAGLDYGRDAAIRAKLQSAVDGAALAGASAYTSPAAQSQATALAQDYVGKGTAALPSGVTVTSSTITPGTTGSGNTLAYTMAVTVTISVPPLFLTLIRGPVAVTVSAKAKNPVVTATISGNGFKSSACDANSVYWYIVPANGGVPDSSALNFIWSNSDATQPALSISLAASQKIGFAMKNVTGGQCSYGNNQYGSKAGDTQWFYSSLVPPNADWNIAPGGNSTGTHGTYPTTKDCSLQVLKGTWSGRSNSWVFSSPSAMCFSATSTPTMSSVTTNAAPSCSDLNGTEYQWAWNDMGGNPDDVDYNDLVFNLQCSGGTNGNGTSTTSVALTN